MRKQFLSSINFLFLAILLTTTVLVAATSRLENNVHNLNNPETLDTPAYDPWYDLNNDGVIDIFDVVKVAGKYGTEGESIIKSGLEYDSGWLNITDKAGQYITIPHNLDITNWNDPSYHVEIVARAVSWASTTPLPEVRAQHASIAYNGRIYIMGGWETAGNDTVYYGNVNPNGTIDSWQETTSLPDRRSETIAVAYNDTIYVLGGQGPGGQLEKNTVWYASINTTDGSLGNWLSTTNLPFQGSGRGAFVWGNKVYVVGGWSGFSFRSDVHFAEINPNGTLGSWTATSSLPEGRGHGVAAIAHKGYAYVLGGQGPPGTPESHFADVWYAKINPDGTIDPWTTTTSMPLGLETHGVAIVNNEVYVIGGYDGFQQRAEVYKATIAGDYTLGEWLTEVNLAIPISLEPRGHLIQTPVLNNRIYVIGGTNSTGHSTNTVFFTHFSNNQIGLLSHLRVDTYMPGWMKTFGGASDDWAYSAVETDDGGYVIVGRTESYGAG
jgi:N-acetylneuraminic acid mutarotase